MQTGQSGTDSIVASCQSGSDLYGCVVEKHDEVFAHTSPSPHLMAFELGRALANREDKLDIFRYAAGGFRQFITNCCKRPTYVA